MSVNTTGAAPRASVVPESAEERTSDTRTHAHARDGAASFSGLCTYLRGNRSGKHTQEELYMRVCRCVGGYIYAALVGVVRGARARVRWHLTNVSVCPAPKKGPFFLGCSCLSPKPLRPYERTKMSWVVSFSFSITKVCVPRRANPSSSSASMMTRKIMARPI